MSEYFHHDGSRNSNQILLWNIHFESKSIGIHFDFWSILIYFDIALTTCYNMCFFQEKVPNGLAPLRDHRAVRHGIRPHVAGNLDTNNTNNTYASYASGRSREDRTLRFRLTAVNSRHPICHRISKLRVRFVNPFFSPSNSCIHIPFVKATDAQWSLWSPQKVTRFDSLKFTQETELSEIMKPWAWYCSDCSSCPTCLQDAKMPRMWMKGSFKKIRNKTKQKKSTMYY